MSDYSAPPPAPQPYDPPQQTGSVPGQPAPGRTLGIVAFIASFFIQLLGLILGIVALVQSRKAGRKNGFALAAIIISIVLGVIVTVGIIIAVIAAISLGPAAGQVLEGVQQCQQLGDSGTVIINGQEVQCNVILDELERQGQ